MCEWKGEGGLEMKFLRITTMAGAIALGKAILCRFFPEDNRIKLQSIDNVALIAVILVPSIFNRNPRRRHRHYSILFIIAFSI